MTARVRWVTVIIGLEALAIVTKGVGENTNGVVRVTRTVPPRPRPVTKCPTPTNPSHPAPPHLEIKAYKTPHSLRGVAE